MKDFRVRLTEPGWVLLVLRAFLAVVYLDGGISKIADSRFLDDSSPVSMHASVVAIKPLSPIGGLFGPVVDHSFAFGLLMAIGELAVGIGMVLGLFVRVAAAGGMLLALSLWLTVSWGANPWFTSADLVYLFAFTPLLLAGSGGVLSLDGWLAQAARAHPGRSEDRTRRALVAGAAGVGALVVLGAASLTRKSTPSSTADAGDSGDTPAPTTPAAGSSEAAGSPGAASSPAVGAELVKASDVPVGKGKQVIDPVSGNPDLGAPAHIRQFHGVRRGMSTSGLPGQLRVGVERVQLPLSRLALQLHRQTRAGAGHARSRPGRRPGGRRRCAPRLTPTHG